MSAHNKPPHCLTVPFACLGIVGGEGLNGNDAIKVMEAVWINPYSVVKALTEACESVWKVPVDSLMP
jgi:hypothetical protein